MLKTRVRLGDLLESKGLLTADDVNKALVEQQESGRKLGSILVSMGLVSEEQLVAVLADHMQLPVYDLDRMDIPRHIVTLLPEVFARRFRALVIGSEQDTYQVAMADPADVAAIDALGAKLDKPLTIGLAGESQLLRAFERLYRNTEAIDGLANELQSEVSTGAEFQLTFDSEQDDDTAVAKLLQTLFEDAILASASDIHIEPDQEHLRIRQRIDGVLQETLLKQKNITSALTLRLKLMAGMDISERRLPQDGRLQTTVKGRTIDVRISTMPVQQGESVVMRLLDQSKGILSFEAGGMPPDLANQLRQLLARPNGMILVTGPTGSGKTTTLYSALSELNQPENKIITVEDPVEYQLSRVNQVQVNTRIDLSFANVLRTALRQDPDIIMVGEMRDQETVEIGLRAALTGHLVLSTLHTNDTISSAIRLLDMGAPGYLVASALRAIIAQRLIKKLCEHCKQQQPLTSAQAAWLSQIGYNGKREQFYSATGCSRCGHRGYRGRVGVYEFLEVDEPMIEALKASDLAEFSTIAKAKRGRQNLAESALERALVGDTSLDEVLRLVEFVPDSEQSTQQGNVSNASALSESSYQVPARDE